MQMVWITWESQVRNRSVSRRLGAQLFELQEERHRLLRYLFLTLRTLPILFAKKYKVIFSQNPSIVLSLLNVLAAKISGKVAIVDAHNSGIFPAEEKYGLLTAVNDFVLRNADHVIVTNDALAKVISEKKGQPFVLPDPIPEFDGWSGDESPKGETFTFLLVCSWAEDEPYMEVIEAAKSLPKYSLYITGRYQKKLSSDFATQLPENIVLTGYVTDKSYEQLLRRVDIVIDLTTRENCMVCGAYEAAATSTPAILSDHRVNRAYFKPGYIFTKNDRESIKVAMKDAAASIERLKVGIKEFSEQASASWIRDKEKLLAGLAKKCQ